MIHTHLPRREMLSNTTDRGGLSRLAAWYLPGGLVGPLARWTATSNFEVVRWKV